MAGKFNDIMPKAQPNNFVEQRSQNKKNKFQRKPRKDGKARDGRGFSMPQVPVQNMVDVVKEQNRGRNQVLDRTSRRPSERTMYGDRIGEEEVRNPFKNGYFKPTRDQSASKNVDLNRAGADARATAQEQSNAQKLFASISGNETHSDSQGNRVAYKDGRPVGFSGKPDKNGKVMGQGRNPDSVLLKKGLGNTEEESAQNRQNIQNVAQQFEQGKFELPSVPDHSQALAFAQGLGTTQNPDYVPPTNNGPYPPVTLPVEQTKPANVGMFPHAPGQFNPMDVPGLLPKIGSAISQGTNQIKDWMAEYLMGQQPTNLDTYFQNQLPKVQEARKQFNMPVLQ